MDEERDQVADDLVYAEQKLQDVLHMMKQLQVPPPLVQDAVQLVRHLEQQKQHWKTIDKQTCKEMLYAELVFWMDEKSKHYGSIAPICMALFRGRDRLDRVFDFASLPTPTEHGDSPLPGDATTASSGNT